VMRVQLYAIGLLLTAAVVCRAQVTITEYDHHSRQLAVWDHKRSRRQSLVCGSCRAALKSWILRLASEQFPIT